MGESPVEDPALPFSPVEAVAGADDARLRLRFADASHSLAGVRLIQDTFDPYLTALLRRVAA